MKVLDLLDEETRNGLDAGTITLLSDKTAVLLDDRTYYALHARLLVVETRLDHLDSVLTGQREIMDHMVRVMQKNGGEIAALNRKLSEKADATMLALTIHAKEEAQGRVKFTRSVLFTFVSTLATLCAVVLGSVMNHWLY